jgi:hypothetical protein
MIAHTVLHSLASILLCYNLTLQEAFSYILAADFFVVFGFLLYFVAAVAARSLFQDGSLLDKFSELWTPIIQPALGLLMAGTIVGGTVSKLGGSDDPEQQ